MTLAERCIAHSHKMDLEGWYVTSNVLWLAAEEIERLRKALIDIRDAKDPPELNPQPDNIDWRYVALESRRVAEVAVPKDESAE